MDMTAGDGWAYKSETLVGKASLAGPLDYSRQDYLLIIVEII